MPDIVIWRLPKYKLYTNSGLDDQESFKEIPIDVTRSVPPFPETGRALTEALSDALNDFSAKSEINILDYGAGRFRNTIHLLRSNPKNHVGAVEFRELEDAWKTHIPEANRFHQRFKQIVYPEDFFGTQQKFDLVIFINVLNIMPVPAERLLAINYCREKLNEGGMILWYSQHKDRYYQEKCREQNILGDGYYMSPKGLYKTFYKDFEPHEVDEMFLANGMKFERKIVESGVIARLYKVRTSNPTASIVTPELIRTHVRADEDFPAPENGTIKTVTFRRGAKPNLPNPRELSFEKLYSDSLNDLLPGADTNFAYQNLVAAIFARIFVRVPDHIELEKEIIGGQKRIDIVITNKADSGFFHMIRETHRIISPYILVECKNYSEGLTNAEFDQLAGRFSDDWGRFGILVCRSNINKQAALDKTRAVRRLEPKNHVICLEDSDLIRLLQLHLDDADEADEYMNGKLEEIKLN